MTPNGQDAPRCTQVGPDIWAYCRNAYQDIPCFCLEYSGNILRFRIFIFANYYFLSNAKIKKSTAAAVEFGTLIFAGYHVLFNTTIQSSKFDRGSGRICEL